MNSNVRKSCGFPYAGIRLLFAVGKCRWLRWCFGYGGIFTFGGDCSGGAACSGGEVEVQGFKSPVCLFGIGDVIAPVGPGVSGSRYGFYLRPEVGYVGL